MPRNQKIQHQVTKLDAERQKLEKKKKKIIPYFLFVPIAFIASVLVIKTPGPAFFFTLFVFLITWLAYYNSIVDPFNKLKIDLRKALLSNFMQSYHPGISYSYYEGRKNVKDIVKRSKLISAEIYKEEDVIEGEMKGTKFYISEIHLKKKANKSEYTVFQGMLFRLKIPGKHYPKSQIQSKPGLIKRMFTGFLKDEKHNFYYETEDNGRFNNQLGPLFPFFKHLIEKNKDVRIRIEGNELILMLSSDIKFLDDPKPRLESGFDNPKYYQKLAQHLNAFLYIVETISSGLDALELEEKLKVKLENYTKLSS